MLGLGIGIILVTIWFFVSSLFAEPPAIPDVVVEELSNGEIIERAKALGLVTKEDLDMAENDIVELTDNDIVEKARVIGMYFPEELSYTEDNENTLPVTEDGLPEDTDIDTANVPDETENPVETEVKEYVEFRIFAGMTAQKVALLLSEKKIIPSFRDFERYIIEKGATTKIRTGLYNMAKGTEFAEILHLLTTSPSEQ